MVHAPSGEEEARRFRLYYVNISDPQAENDANPPFLGEYDDRMMPPLGENPNPPDKIS